MSYLQKIQVLRTNGDLNNDDDDYFDNYDRKSIDNGGAADTLKTGTQGGVAMLETKKQTQPLYPSSSSPGSKFHRSAHQNSTLHFKKPGLIWKDKELNI